VLLHQGTAVLAESDAPPELQCGQTPGQMNADVATSVGCGGYLFSFSWLWASVTNLEEEAVGILDPYRPGTSPSLPPGLKLSTASAAIGVYAPFLPSQYQSDLSPERDEA
jgi:hypothetical protein